MSKIAEQIQKLKDKEKYLERETRKVDFLNHILTSAEEYNHVDFADIKDDVIAMLKQFVKKQIEAIEVGTEVTITVGKDLAMVTVKSDEAPKSVQVAPEQPQPIKFVEPSAAEKMNFALDNRHLAGKKVAVANDKNVDIRGSVVGLDAPYVLVKTDTGPTIRVPLDRVVLQ